MSVAEVDLENTEGWLVLIGGAFIVFLKKYFRPFWRRLIISQVLTGHKKLKEYRAKETLTDAEKDEYIDIVEDALKF